MRIKKFEIKDFIKKDLSIITGNSSLHYTPITFQMNNNMMFMACLARGSSKPTVSTPSGQNYIWNFPGDVISSDPLYCFYGAVPFTSGQQSLKIQSKNNSVSRKTTVTYEDGNTVSPCIHNLFITQINYCKKQDRLSLADLAQHFVAQPINQK